MEDKPGADASRAGDGADQGLVVGLVGDAEAVRAFRVRADERAGSGRAGDVELLGEVGAADFEDLAASGAGDVELGLGCGRADADVASA